jgi:hypothetical protein
MLPLFVLLLAPASAQASCGSNVQINGQHTRTSDESARTASAHEQPQPCRGPHCSGRPLGLPETPPAPPSLSTGKDLSLNLTSPEQPEGPISLCLDEPLARPSHIGPDISRPPR